MHQPKLNPGWMALDGLEAVSAADLGEELKQQEPNIRGYYRHHGARG